MRSRSITTACLAVLFTAATLTACGGDNDDDPTFGNDTFTQGNDTSTSGPSCGDGVCNGNETAASCSVDCGCVDSQECGLEEVCVGSACRTAWGRSYRFTIVGVEFPTTKPDTGEAWDAFGGAPDPIVVVFADGSELGRTDVVQDSFSATYNATVDVVFEGAASPQELQFSVFDDDATAPDSAGGVYDSPEGWLQLARGSQTLTQELSASTITLRLEPM